MKKEIEALKQLAFAYKNEDADLRSIALSNPAWAYVSKKLKFYKRFNKRKYTEWLEILKIMSEEDREIGEKIYESL